MGRTNVVVDDELILKVMRLYGFRTMEIEAATCGTWRGQVGRPTSRSCAGTG